MLPPRPRLGRVLSSLLRHLPEQLPAALFARFEAGTAAMDRLRAEGVIGPNVALRVVGVEFFRERRFEQGQIRARQTFRRAHRNQLRERHILRRVIFYNYHAVGKINFVGFTFKML